MRKRTNQTRSLINDVDRLDLEKQELPGTGVPPQVRLHPFAFRPQKQHNVSRTNNIAD